jgi:hypothetical protein
MRRPTINLTTRERFARVAIGLVGIFAGLLLLRHADPAGVVVLEILLVLAGLDMLVTGALGHCPLYKKLGHVPSSLRGAA